MQGDLGAAYAVTAAPAWRRRSCLTAAEAGLTGQNAGRGEVCSAGSAHFGAGGERDGAGT